MSRLNPLSSEEFETYKDFALRLADTASKQTLPRFRAGGEVFNKAGIWYDPVTDADREAERAQRRLIKAAFPDHGILGEEFGEENAGAALRWVLDPIDGTRAFIYGAPTWTTLIALEVEGAPVLSIIDQPFTQERWVGVPGETTLVVKGEERTCRASAEKDLERARLSTTDPRGTAYFTAAEAAAFDSVAERARLARFGFDAYGYGLLAAGMVDLVIEAGLAHHDYAALKPIVEGAGGVISNWRGGAFDAADGGRIIASAGPALHETAIALLASADGL